MFTLMGRTLAVLTTGVCLAFGLRAGDPPAELMARQQAARTALQHRDYEEAVRLFGECVSFATTTSDRVIALASYGIALNRAGRNADAKIALEEALAERQRAGGVDERVVILGVLASVDRSLGDYQGAERVLRAAIGDSSANSKARASLMVNLADLLREQARGNEAKAVLDEANLLTGLSQQERTSILVESAELTRDLHLWNESIAAWNKVGEIAGQSDSPALDATFAGGLGETWFVAGNVARAEPLLRRSLQLLRDDPASPPSQIATALGLMARIYVRENRLALADEALDEAIAKDEGSLGMRHPQVATLLELKADVLSRRGETQAARDDAERAGVIITAHFGADSAAMAGVLTELGDVESRAKLPEAAVKDYGLAMGLLRAAGPDGARFEPDLAARYAAALRAAHRPAEARALVQSFSPQPAVSGVAGFRGR